MRYLVKKIQSDTYEPKVLYVSDTHSFNLKGKKVISLTDLRYYAQAFNIEEATEFVKTHKDFVIEEKYESFEDNEKDSEEYDDYEEYEDSGE